MLKIRLAWLWCPRVWRVLSWLRVIWLVDLTCERHERNEREFCMRPFKITELEKRRWSWISNCGEALHTDSWLVEANPGHSDPDAILQALLPGPSTVVLFGPGKARMAWQVHLQVWTWLLSEGSKSSKQRSEVDNNLQQTHGQANRHIDGQQNAKTLSPATETGDVEERTVVSSAVPRPAGLHVLYSINQCKGTAWPQ